MLRRSLEENFAASPAILVVMVTNHGASKLSGPNLLDNQMFRFINSNICAIQRSSHGMRSSLPSEAENRG